MKLNQTKAMVDEKERSLQKQAFGLQQQLATRLEQLKDTQEQNTALQLQLDTLAKTHQELRAAYDELVASKRSLESRIAELDASFGRCRAELGTLREHHDRLLESEATLKKQLEIEKLASKTARLQCDKDAKCIQDLKRQVKEMERILQRKHPDSVSTVLAAARAEPDGGLSARSLLESRIRQLENEASAREAHSNSLFTDIQDKFSQMKAKYESHIEDLEIHVNDLKRQLQSRAHTYDIYTQTYELATTTTPPPLTTNTAAAGTQTEEVSVRPVRASSAPTTNKKATEAAKEDAHLLATIRGLQADLAAKEKLLAKLHKEVEELRKTNRKLQKERETILREKRDHKHHNTNVKTPDTNVAPGVVDILPNKNHGDNDHDADDESERRALRDERDKLKAQLCRLEDDYQNLKTKRLQDLNTLQEAHERELSTYMSNIGPMREQLDVQQVSIKTLQQQLANTKEELAIVQVEREHLETRLQAATLVGNSVGTVDENALQKKIAYLERRYEEREHRLRAIVHGLAQKQVSGRDCSQCAARHQQLIGYKAELDQLLATLRYLQ